MIRAILAEQPATKLADLTLAADLAPSSAPPPVEPKPELIAISATFTAEPIQESLQFWINKLNMPARVEFAPYNQVFQQLLDPNSLLARNTRGLNVVLVRVEDWQRSESESAATENGAAPAQLDLARETIETNARELGAALKTAAQAGGEFLVCFCPSWKLTPTPTTQTFLEELETNLATDLAGTSGIHVVTSRQLLDLYPVADFADAEGDRLGHVPYTPAFFAALGTKLARQFDAWKRPRPKVIALDCDQTLWAGICGEDGPQGIRLDPPYRALQEFMRARLAEGVLLCLCSKNNEADVDAVFAAHPEMSLRREDFAASRINWNRKSENLRALAQELGLGLDSFVFVDDNPMECAEVEANAPEVLALQLPSEAERFPQFLRHCWIFDRWKITTEDAQRTHLYRQNREREQLLAGSTTLREFIDRLDLEVRIEPLVPEQVTRVAQLTQRTNQFNFTTRRLAERDILEWQQKERGDVLTASVKDRFGDYGLVGVILFECARESLVVDTFLLSCRVLGRGVEQQIVAHL